MHCNFSLFLCYILLYIFCFFFFKQKTAYEMRISDWSSDVCSSDLAAAAGPGSLAHPRQPDRARPAAPGARPLPADGRRLAALRRRPRRRDRLLADPGPGLRGADPRRPRAPPPAIGRASCRARECPSVSIMVVATSLILTI